MDSNTVGILVPKPKSCWSETELGENCLEYKNNLHRTVLKLTIVHTAAAGKRASLKHI